MASVALHFGNIRSDLNGDIGDGVDGGVWGIGYGGVGVRCGIIVETVGGWGRGNCRSRVEHCTRDKSRDSGGKRKRGKGERQRRIDFKWTGIRTGPSSFYRYSNLKFDLKTQGLSSPPLSLLSPLPSLISIRRLCCSDRRRDHIITLLPPPSPLPPLQTQAWVG